MNTGVKSGLKVGPDNEAALVARVAKRLIPFLCLLYVIAYLDRVNVGFAQIAMKKDLGFGDKVYGIGSGIFFFGYFLFEIPSNLILERVGARKWIARIMVTWGFLAMAMLFTHNKVSFFAFRFLLGIAEAGFYPGVILYLTYWFSPTERGRMVGWFMTATMIANIVGSPVSGALLGVHGWGLRGWQWLFVLEGLPAVVLAFVVLVYLPNGPEDAKFLRPEERDWLLARREAEHRANPHRHVTLRAAFANPRLWHLTLLYFSLTFGMYGVNLWLPQIVQGFDVKNNFIVGLLTAIPYLAAAFGTVLIGIHSDKTQERRLHVAVPAFLGGIFLAASAYMPTPALKLTMIAFAAVGMWGTLGGFWSLPVSFLQGTAAAGGIALINSLGNLGGFAGPFAVGAIKEATHSFKFGLLTLSCSLCCGSLLALALRKPTAPRAPVEDPVEDMPLFAAGE